MRNVVQLFLACFWLQILFCSCINETACSLLVYVISVIIPGRQCAQRHYLLKNKLSDRMIKQIIIELGYRKIL